MDTNKAIKTYGKYYQEALKRAGFNDIDNKMLAFENRLQEMYASVMAMCLELKSFGYSDPEIIEIVNRGFDKRRNRFKKIIAFVNILPNSFNIARKWNLNDMRNVRRTGASHTIISL